jgi:hypothetical protein
MKWNEIDWKRIDLEVSSLQRRIYRASLNNDLDKIHVLQDLLINSLINSAKLKAVRRVTQENRHTTILLSGVNH